MKRKQTSRFISLLLVIVLIVCMTPTAFAADYNDTAENAWYHTAVDYVTNRNLMAGTGRGNFEPETSMTRAMLVTILHRIEGSPEVSGNGGFSDVPDGNYYTTAVAWAEANQIVNGVEDGRFAPHSRITRQEFASILYRYANAKGYDTSAYATFDGYSDASQIHSYAETAMHWAVGSQILRGSSNSLTPSGSATRGQAAALFMRFMENIAKEEPAEPTIPALPEEGMITMDITVGNKTFTAKMYDNETTKALIAQLPMTVNMSELNGLEKFYDLPSDLPAESTERPASIHAGEIMIWSSNTLVLFYNTFSNSNVYVKVGYIEDISGLASALGTGSVKVTFSVSQ
ncbi:cyclophilin-like fold protein [Paenibacillus harenae]|uniref:cyclophilin-like fold protein n=1 Tax=Paenibacillus harenae TaxID=306543 RepID=UPI00041EC732|nr:cyclophilin-like fold protein [Paenibacillus harenae]